MNRRKDSTSITSIDGTCGSPNLKPISVKLRLHQGMSQTKEQKTKTGNRQHYIQPRIVGDFLRKLPRTKTISVPYVDVVRLSEGCLVSPSLRSYCHGPHASHTQQLGSWSKARQQGHATQCQAEDHELFAKGLRLGLGSLGQAQKQEAFWINEYIRKGG